MDACSRGPGRSWRLAALVAAALGLVGLAWFVYGRFGIGANPGFWLNEVKLLHTTEGPLDHSFVAPEELLELPVNLFLLLPASALLALALAPRAAAWRLPEPSRQLWAGLAAAAAAGAAAASWLVLGRSCILADETAYWVQSRILLLGKFWLPAVDPPALVANPLMLGTGAGYTAAYYPVWPAMLAPGSALGEPYLVLPLYAALALLACRFAWQRLAPGPVCLLAALHLLLSPMFLLNAGTLLNEVPDLMALGLFLGAVLRADETGARRWQFAAGAALGLSLALRPLTAVAWGTAVAAYLLWRHGLLGSVRRHGWALVPLALSAGVMAGYNAALTGDCFITPYEAYDPFAHLGFGIRGYERVTHDAARGALNLGITATRMTPWLFGWPLSLVFIPFAFLPQAQTSSQPAALAPAGREGLLAALVGCHLLAYFFFFHPGVGRTGPHYYLELLLPCALLSSLGVVRLARALAARPEPWLRGLTAAGLVSLISIGVLTVWPQKIQSVRTMAEHARRPYLALDRAGLRQAVVFLAPFHLPPAHGGMRGTRALHPDLKDPADVLYLNDPGGPAERRRCLERWGRGRPAYLYDYRALALLPLGP